MVFSGVLACLGLSWARLGASLARLGGVLARLGRVLASKNLLSDLMGPSSTFVWRQTVCQERMSELMGPSGTLGGRVLEASWRVLARLRRVLGAS